MVKDKDKLFIECECVDRCSILTLDYLKDYKGFFLEFYRKYSFKHKKEIYSLSITEDDAQYIIEYFQKKPEDRKDIFIECKSSNISGGLTLEWMGKFDMFSIDFYRKYRFNKQKEIYGLTFSEDQAKQIIDFLQNKLNKEVSS